MKNPDTIDKQNTNYNSIHYVFILITVFVGYLKENFEEINLRSLLDRQFSINAKSHIMKYTEP